VSIRNLLETQFPLGTTEETPSLESFFPDLFGQDQELEISNEGISEAVANFFGDIKRNFKEGGKPTDWKYSIKHVREAIRLYYANPQWLEKRRFVEKDLKLTHAIPYLAVNNEVATPEQARDALNDLKVWMDKTTKEVAAYYRRLEPIARDLSRSEVNDETLRDISDRVNALTLPETAIAREMERKFEFPLGNRIYVKRGFTEPMRTSVRHVPAMTQQEIIAHAQVMLEYLDVMDAFWGQIRDLSTNRTVSFAADQSWHGWTQINEYLYGKNNIAKHIPKGSEVEIPQTDNPWLNMGTRILSEVGTDMARDMLTDENRAKAWMSLLRPFKGTPPPITTKFKEIIYSVVRSYAIWIDASIR